MGVYKHNGLLKASIMSATNAHRLGANEAPPAIISSFLGKQLTDLLDHIEKADKEELFALAGKKGMELDIPEIPELMIDNTEGVTEQDAKIAGIAHDRGKAIIVAVNKWDAVEKDDKTIYRFTERVKDTLSFMPYAEILFLSAKTGQRM